LIWILRLSAFVYYRWFISKCKGISSRPLASKLLITNYVGKHLCEKAIEHVYGVLNTIDVKTRTYNKQEDMNTESILIKKTTLHLFSLVLCLLNFLIDFSYFKRLKKKKSICEVWLNSRSLDFMVMWFTKIVRFWIMAICLLFLLKSINVLLKEVMILLFYDILHA
jgi:hypothetical protein